MLFLSFIKGDKVQEWTQGQVQWAFNHLNGGGADTDAHIWTTTITDAFVTAFTNITKALDVQTSIKDLQMKGENGLDNYKATFEHLAQISSSNLNN